MSDMKDSYLELSRHRLRYRIDGQEGPWLLFSNSLGTDLHMWDLQAAELSGAFRILRYDTRGHGKSSTPKAPYSIADLGGDALALLDALGIESAHFCGLSLGGLTGQWLGINAGHRLNRLVLCATAARIGSADSWNARIEAVKAEGLLALTEATKERWFTPGFSAQGKGDVVRVIESFVSTSQEGYIGCCMALGSTDLRSELGKIHNPLLAISGADDPVCPPYDLETIAKTARQGRHLSLPGRHIVNIESARAFDHALRGFCTEVN